MKRSGFPNAHRKPMAKGSGFQRGRGYILPTVGISYTHEKLVDVAREWLQRYHPVVLTELTVTGGECADAMGFKFKGDTTLIECKTSRSDFLADKKKPFRILPENGMGKQRYFLAPAGLLNPDELPPGWGLLEWNGRYVATRLTSAIFGVRNDNAERGCLVSTLRRLGLRVDHGVSIRCYSHDLYEKTTGRESKNKATVSVQKSRHLFPGTNDDNIADKMSKGRQSRGETSGPRLHPERMASGSKRSNLCGLGLVDDDIRDIRQRAASGEKQAHIAEDYKCCQSHISRIVTRSIWKGVPE